MSRAERHISYSVEGFCVSPGLDTPYTLAKTSTSYVRRLPTCQIVSVPKCMAMALRIPQRV
jgi:hypothetical protein